jgi:dihydrofolate reductase
MKSIVVAIANNNVIGAHGDLPWGRTMKDDLAHFKKLTTGGSLIMGRKTFESIGRKPLPDRENIVVSRTPTGIKGVMTAMSLPAALDLARYEVFIIGGSMVFAETIDIMDRLYITEVKADFPDADVFFPPIDTGVWREISREDHQADERNAYDYSFVTYERIR